MSKKKKSNSKLKSMLIPFIMGAVLGGFLGVNIIKSTASTSATKGEQILFICGLFLVMILSLYVHIIIHELGHLVCGLISGYTFVSFRVGSLMIIKEDGKLKRKKFNIVGTGGQCLMIPPNVGADKCPFILYNLGGSLFNFITASIFLALYFVSAIPLFISETFFIFFIFGMIYFLSNALPLKINNMANDGYNILELRRDKTARDTFYNMLNINALLQQGKRLKDMPYEWVKLPEDADLSNPIICNTACYEIGYFHDKKDFDKARELSKKLLEKSTGILDVHKKEIQCELLFYELINECREDEIKSIYTKELEKYIKQTEKCYISRKRLLYTYELIYSKDSAKAENKLMEFHKLAEKFPYAGEVKSEFEIIEFVKALLKIA